MLNTWNYLLLMRYNFSVRGMEASIFQQEELLINNIKKALSAGKKDDLKALRKDIGEIMFDLRHYIQMPRENDGSVPSTRLVVKHGSVLNDLCACLFSPHALNLEQLQEVENNLKYRPGFQDNAPDLRDWNSVRYL